MLERKDNVLESHVLPLQFIIHNLEDKVKFLQAMIEFYEAFLSPRIASVNLKPNLKDRNGQKNYQKVQIYGSI
jgi:hypothetical protein